MEFQISACAEALETFGTVNLLAAAALVGR